VSGVRPGVVFDLDGTLVDSEPYWVKGFSTGLAQILEERGHGKHELDPHHMARFQGGRVLDTVGAILEWLHLGSEIDAPEASAIVQQVITYVTQEFVANPTPIEETVATVRALRADGVPLAIASSSALSFIDAVLDVLDLKQAFPVRVSAVGLPRGKPDSAVYLLALRQLGLPPQLSVAVEDSRVGVVAAVNAKMRCVWFLPGQEAGYMLSQVTDLAAQPGNGAKNESDIARLVDVSSHLSPEFLSRILDELTSEQLDNDCGQ
jgi:HAD superfamily hydrolase (TIGR01509 family)